MAKMAKRPPKRKPLKLEDEKPRIHTCSACGLETTTPLGRFYRSPWSKKYQATDGYSTICKTCMNDLYKYYTKKYDNRSAMLICCHLIDVPFIHELFESNNLKRDNSDSELGIYMRCINGKQYNGKTFCTTLVDGTLNKTRNDIDEKKEERWTKVELDNKNVSLEIIGYDPFQAYPTEDRRILFSEIVKYFDEDIQEDQYKLSQVIQIVNNNNQIRNCDLTISRLDIRADADEIKKMNSIKKDLVASNDKIAKENEISVKNRSNKEAGKSTLTKMMKTLREDGFSAAEHNYYDQLQSEGTKWATNISMAALKENCYFDENDVNDIIETQRDLIAGLQEKLETATENYRLARVENEKNASDLKAYKGN